jgi:DNA repair exonuclease SbcCD nuclease subunit
MAFYIFGDTHGPIETSKLNQHFFPEGKDLTRDDYAIVCGDFGLPFLNCEFDPGSDTTSNSFVRERRVDYVSAMKWLKSLPFTILFVDGNHDNHPYWNSLPTEEWQGGLISRSPDADNVIHLKRGEIFEIDGYSFFTFGGAASVDKEVRTFGIDWWPDEVAGYAQMKHGLDKLEKHGNTVDFIITHTMPASVVKKLGFGYNFRDPVADYLDEVLHLVDYRHWYCGHMHIDRDLPEYLFTVIYEEYHNAVTSLSLNNLGGEHS